MRGKSSQAEVEAMLAEGKPLSESPGGLKWTAGLKTQENDSPRRKISSFNYHRTHTHTHTRMGKRRVCKPLKERKEQQMFGARSQAYFQSERRWSQRTGDQFRRAVSWNAERRIQTLAVLGKKD